MIPWKPTWKRWTKKEPIKAWTSKKSKGETQGDKQQSIRKSKGLKARGSSNRSKSRQAWQAEMIQTYAHERRCAWRHCSDTFGVFHAHRLKKRFILTEEEWVHGQVKLCLFHHTYVENGDHVHRGTHRRMYRLITLLMIKLDRPTK